MSTGAWEKFSFFWGRKKTLDGTNGVWYILSLPQNRRMQMKSPMDVDKALAEEIDGVGKGDHA